MQIPDTQKPLLVALTMVASLAFLIMAVMTRQHSRSRQGGNVALVVRVAVFSNEQGQLDDYRTFSTAISFRRCGAFPVMWHLSRSRREQRSADLIELLATRSRRRSG